MHQFLRQLRNLGLSILMTNAEQNKEALLDRADNLALYTDAGLFYPLHYCSHSYCFPVSNSMDESDICVAAVKEEA
ncbi:hypothetical protein KSZ_45430 [Dictyobacter formicarum]|uniref:Uncharacterized protein n=1 Tax=Dictyobacter formicarum TaxID=2778368 RepID=A0ABQ3VK28_9CHLR|nr:hypothetical protein KSZ_45430 [Dictyobacter formicarum]